ncbi:hypothetical protein [Listeria booriae]|uniref:hypothetical protein n=1 Tax=Listeria booriae TaxID=1552123 RepID=UPI001629FA9C|nr:hypothetical protein [Listeria booriae]MBC2163402.1 hypothetical protein [Listeria booriae]
MEVGNKFKGFNLSSTEKHNGLKDVSKLMERFYIDAEEQECFLMTIRAAIKRAWLCEVHVFRQFEKYRFKLLHFEDELMYANQGEIVDCRLTPLRLIEATQEVEFIDLDGYIRIIEFRNIMKIEFV